MNKTLNINLAGLIFHIDEDAFKQLERYLDTLKRQFRQTDGGNEIVSDIESRIAELFRERTSNSKEVITLTDVLEVIEVMGQPEDYADTAADEESEGIHTGYTRSKRIFRDPDHRVIAGVSSGVAAYFNIDAIWIRLLFVLLFFSGPGFLVYIIMWIVIPKAKTTADKLMMRGEPVNISNIQRSIKEEFTDMKTDYRYGKSNSGIGGFLGQLGQFLADAIRLIFKFILKIIGVVLLFTGFVLLFSIVAALVMGTVDVNGSSMSIQYALDFLQLTTVSSSHYNMLLVGIMLSVAAPLFLLIYFGIRILFDLDPLNRPTKSGLAFTTLIGLALLGVSVAKIANEFKDDAEVTYDLNLPQHQQYFLTTGDDSISMQFSEDFQFGNWLPLGDQNAFNMVNIDVKQTDEELPYLEIIRQSQGVTRMQARNNAENMRYEIQISDSVITIPAYYILDMNNKFRAQQVDVNIYLPAGHSVYLDHSLQEYLYDVDNLQNMWDDNMTGLLWHMTEDGLTCDGCEIPGDMDSEEADTLNTEDEWLDDSAPESETDSDSSDTDDEEGKITSADADDLFPDVYSLYSEIASPVQTNISSAALHVLRNQIRLVI